MGFTNNTYPSALKARTQAWIKPFPLRCYSSAFRELLFTYGHQTNGLWAAPDSGSDIANHIVEGTLPLQSAAACAHDVCFCFMSRLLWS